MMPTHDRTSSKVFSANGSASASASRHSTSTRAAAPPAVPPEVVKDRYLRLVEVVNQIAWDEGKAETRERAPLATAFVRESLMRQDGDGYARSCEALADAPAAEVEKIEAPTLLVTGGSLGAQRLNDTLRARVEALSQAGVQVLHVTGLGKEFTAETPAGGAPYVVVPYVEGPVLDEPFGLAAERRVFSA